MKGVACCQAVFELNDFSNVAILSSMTEDIVYRANITTVQMRPMDGVYIFSTVAQMRPPPIQVAVKGIQLS